MFLKITICLFIAGATQGLAHAQSNEEGNLLNTEIEVVPSAPQVNAKAGESLPETKPNWVPEESEAPKFDPSNLESSPSMIEFRRANRPLREKKLCYLKKHGIFWYVNLEGDERFSGINLENAQNLLHKLQSNGTCMHDHEVGWRSTYPGM